MPSQQVKMILDRILDVHRAIVERYRELGEATADERVRLVSEDVQRREKRFINCITEFEQEGHASLLGTWLQFVPQELFELENLRAELAQPGDFEDLLDQTILFNAKLEQTYRQFADSAELPKLRELFVNLAKLEERDKLHYAKSLLND